MKRTRGKQETHWVELLDHRPWQSILRQDHACITQSREKCEQQARSETKWGERAQQVHIEAWAIRANASQRPRSTPWAARRNAQAWLWTGLLQTSRLQEQDQTCPMTGMVGWGSVSLAYGARVRYYSLDTYIYICVCVCVCVCVCEWVGVFIEKWWKEARKYSCDEGWE